jgi:hypothetical protein
MRRDSPNLPLGANPIPASGLLPIKGLHLNASDAAFQRERSVLTTHQPSLPEGKKTG